MIYVLGASEGISRALAVEFPSGNATPVCGEDEEQVALISLAPEPRMIASKISRLDESEALYVSSVDGTGHREVARPASDWASSLAWPHAEHRWFDTPKGNRVEGWLIKPKDASEALPLLVGLHGGPHSFVQIGYPYHPDWFALVSKGWAVLSLNATGSSSVARSSGDALRGAWGERDFGDHLAAVDALVADGIVDNDRVAITGKSYGGFLAAWAMGHSNRFRSAVISAPVANIVSHFGTSDSGFYVTPYDMGADPDEAGLDLYDRLSPIRCLRNSKTPVLLLQGEDDQRCPLGQAEEVFSHLLYADRAPVELVVYPGGDHHLREQGFPSQRVDFNQRLVDWVLHWDRQNSAAAK